MAKGGGALHMRMRGNERDAMVEVQDSGSGIAPEHRARISSLTSPLKRAARAWDWLSPRASSRSTAATGSKPVSLACQVVETTG